VAEGEEPGEEPTEEPVPTETSADPTPTVTEEPVLQSFQIPM